MASYGEKRGWLSRLSLSNTILLGLSNESALSTGHIVFTRISPFFGPICGQINHSTGDIPTQHIVSCTLDRGLASSLTMAGFECLKCSTLNYYTVFSTILIPSRSINSLMGSQISFSYGARIPGVLKAGRPSSSNWVATPHVTPTDFDMPEYPFGSPRSSSVEVIVSCEQLSAYLNHEECTKSSVWGTRSSGGLDIVDSSRFI